MKVSNQKERGGAPAPPHRIILFAVLLFFAGILTGMGSKPPQVSGPAPDFETETPTGEKVSLKDYRGKPVILTFWATWCEPCKKEMPEIQAAYEKHQEEGLVVLAVNFGETKEKAEAFVKQMGLTFPSLLDRRANIAERYGVVSLPVTFFIDRGGIIRERVVGGTLTKESISDIFLRLKVVSEAQGYDLQGVVEVKHANHGVLIKEK